MLFIYSRHKCLLNYQMLLSSLPEDVLFHILCFLVRYYGPVQRKEYAKMYCRLKDDSIAARVSCKRLADLTCKLVPPPSLRYPCYSVQELCNANLKVNMSRRPGRVVGYITLVEPFLYQRLWGVLPRRNCTAHDCHNNEIWNLTPSELQYSAVPERHVVKLMQNCLASLIRQSETNEKHALHGATMRPTLHMPSWNYVSDFQNFLCRAGICVRRLRPFVVRSRDKRGVVVRWVDSENQFGSGL